MDHPDRFVSPPPPYADSVSTFDPEALYAASDAASLQSRGSFSASSFPRRRFSDASGVLPHESYHTQASSEYSSSSGGHRSQFVDSEGRPVSPPANMTIEETLGLDALRLDTVPRRTRSIAAIYSPISETDDPAVQRSLFPTPPKFYPPSPVSYRPPVRRTGSSPLSPATQFPSPPPPQLQQLPEPPPSLPYIYTFQDKQSGEMILAPPESWTDQTPLVSINVHMNCLIPTSYITTVRRGSGRGEIIAQFEMGISRAEPWLFMGQKRCPLKDVFQDFRLMVKSKLGGRWTWSREGFKLHWDCRDEKASVCWHEEDPQHTPIARIIPASSQPPSSMSTRAPATMLEFHTAAPAIMDEIIISALVVERKRLSPSGGSMNKDLFN